MARRRKRPIKVEPEPRSREELQSLHGEVLDTKELAQKFVITSIIGFEVVVRRKVDNVAGTMRYQNVPRFYYDFRPCE